MVTLKRGLGDGFEALVLTVDSLVYNNREIDVLNGLMFPPRVAPCNAFDIILPRAGSLEH
jgi:isopentenyl diphosphate isomerase/L-lactate dehydrogenase-like FMN-dependent dehydrogenase